MEIDAPPAYLYKVLSEKEWALSHETLSRGTMDTDFIHLAREDQLDRILCKFWGDVESYVLVTLDSAKLQGRLEFESNRPGGDKYYHLYDSNIPSEAVVDTQVVIQ